MKPLLLVLLTAVAISCQQREPVKEPIVGGPCTYRTTLYPAKVLQVLRDDPQAVNVLFEVRFEGGADTLTFHEVNGSYLTAEQAALQGLLPGNEYTMAVDQITSGTCTPTIQRVELKPFKR